MAGETSYVNQALIAGALALCLLGLPASPQQAPASQQQAIPDAPKPQSPLGPVTPGIGSTSSSSSDNAPADPDQPAVGSTLPSTPQQAQQPQSTDRDPVPDLPAAGQGPTAFTLPSLTVNFVEVPFTVKDSKGNLVPGITWRDVRVYENGIRQQMRVFTVDPFPLSIALVIDQSLPFDTMTRVNNALGALPSAFTAYDEVAVFTYNNGPKLQTDFTSGQSPRLAAVVDRAKTVGREPMYYDAGEGLGSGIEINGHAQDNLTPLTSNAPGGPNGIKQVPREVHTLNDAILMAAESLSHAPKGRRRIIYVISDGKEYGSTAKTKDVIRYLQTNQISVYATLTGDSSVDGLGFLDRIHLPLTMRDNLLPVYVAATGGQAFAEYRTRGIENSFAKIAEQVRTQYTVGYYSREPFIDGKFRKLEVRIMKPNLQVIAKSGYYPTPQAQTPPSPLTRPAAD